MPLNLVTVGRENPIQQTDSSVLEDESIPVHAELVERIHLVQPEPPDFVTALDERLDEIAFSPRIAELPCLNDGPHVIVAKAHHYSCRPEGVFVGQVVKCRVR